MGVTSIGRDGEAHDVIDARIDKPRVRLAAGSLVATTGELLRASGVAHERLAQTGVRTPLGEVVMARLSEAGTVEVAGPSAAADVRAVSDAMVELGAEQVLIDGAIDRRAASSPAVADGLRDGHRRGPRRGHRAGRRGHRWTRSISSAPARPAPGDGAMGAGDERPRRAGASGSC